MKIAARDAENHLQRHSLPYITLIQGEEIVLNLESLDAARARARADGYDERQRFDTGSGFKWHDLLAESQNLSLFAPRRLIEVHGEDKTLDKKAGEVLATLVAQSDENVRMLLYLPNLEKAHEKAWYKACFSSGNLDIKSDFLYPADFAKQIDQRLRSARLPLTSDARERLISYCAGNLLAAKQAIEHLALRQRSHDGPIDEDGLLTVLADAAHFNVFAFSDALLQGDWLTTWRVASRLQEEDNKAIIPLARMMERDASVLLQLQQHPDPNQVFSLWRIFKFQQRHYLGARARFKPALLRTLLKLAARLDRLAKGVEKGDPWLILRQFLLLMAQRG